MKVTSLRCRTAAILLENKEPGTVGRPRIIKSAGEPKYRLSRTFGDEGQPAGAYPWDFKGFRGGLRPDGPVFIRSAGEPVSGFSRTFDDQGPGLSDASLRQDGVYSDVGARATRRGNSD